ncbi:hypothetical protein [Sphingomonas ginsenosidimutans]|jgi:hypothetical protein|uniref:hypothetical protein n=1 Tax=Sphingomonas ginsenosidimutans TaxID=862134 RepID=UPI001D363715|nr:hypothetical protein [Sphingomonas ginsenosidimutans]MBY0301235.1 hypothetical protein [Sphingomonas ginsenosidimutans]
MAMRMDLDTEDRFNRYRSAMEALSQLVDGQDPELGRIKPEPFGCLLHVLMDELDRSVMIGGRPPRAVNDMEG